MHDATRIWQTEKLAVRVLPNRAALGRAAAQAVAARMKEVLREKPLSIVFASAPSQNEFLAELCQTPGLDWQRVTAFHLDEYLGLPATAPQCFSRFLRHALFDAVRPGTFHVLDGLAADPEAECRRYEALLQAAPLDIACIGVGENGHLAFNDPPYADFNDPRWVKVIELDLTSRRQQVFDGCFQQLDDVPSRALTLTLPAILSARFIASMVPGARKAEAVRQTLHGPLTANCPSTGLRGHPAATLFLDRDSARLLGTPELCGAAR